MVQERAIEKSRTADSWLARLAPRSQPIARSWVSSLASAWRLQALLGRPLSALRSRSRSRVRTRLAKQILRTPKTNPSDFCKPPAKSQTILRTLNIWTGTHPILRHLGHCWGLVGGPKLPRSGIGLPPNFGLHGEKNLAPGKPWGRHLELGTKDMRSFSASSVGAGMLTQGQLDSYEHRDSVVSKTRVKGKVCAWRWGNSSNTFSSLVIRSSFRGSCEAANKEQQALDPAPSCVSRTCTYTHIPMHKHTNTQTHKNDLPRFLGSYLGDPPLAPNVKHHLQPTVDGQTELRTTLQVVSPSIQIGFHPSQVPEFVHPQSLLCSYPIAPVDCPGWLPASFWVER